MSPFIDESIEKLLFDTKERLAPKVANIISVDLEGDIAELKPVDFGERYLQLPKLVENLVPRTDDSTHNEVMYYCLLCSALSFDRANSVLKIPDSFSHLYSRYFRALCERANTLDNTINNGDTFHKDLGICTGKLILVGARVLGEDAFPRSMLFRGGLSQFLSLFRLLQKSKFQSHGFSMHTHLGYLNEFNSQGWRNSLENCYQLMIENSTLEYIFIGAGWIYDPALFKISPRLKYHVDDGIACGAVHAYYGELPANCGALSKSKTRQKLFHEGMYWPHGYFLIWHREALIRNIGNIR